MSKQKPPRINFRSKLWKVCSDDNLRPLMQCVYIKDEHFYATNGYLLAAHHCEAHEFEPRDVKEADGKLIHRNVMADLYKYDQIEFTETGIKAYIRPGLSYVLYPYYETKEKFPNVSSVLALPQREPDAKDFLEFGVNLNRLSELKESFVSNSSGTFRIRVAAPNRAIFVQPEGDRNQVGLIMPVHLNFGSDDSIEKNLVVLHNYARPISHADNNSGGDKGTQA